jgi:curli biogenesis system outer membrane secretion channel CsgG
MFKRMTSAVSAGSLVLSALLSPVSPAFAGPSKHKLEIPHCARSLGVMSVVEPQTKWWEKYGLGSPEAVIKYYVSESGCFKLVDRGQGFEATQRERALAAAGVLRRHFNIGKGQVRAADYVLTPDLLSSNENSGGTAIAGIVGAFLPGAAGAVLGGLKFSSKTADVTLSLINVRSSDADIIVRGSAKNMDMGWAAGGGTVGESGLGALGAGGYTNTEVGKVIMTAYLDAYIKLVQQLGGLPADPVAAGPKQAYSATSLLKMHEGPSVKDRVVGSVAAGALLYPTGNEAQGWVEVQDEMDNKGWVPKSHLQLAK